MIDKIIALDELRPGEKWSWTGDNYSGLVWEDETDKPTKDEIDAKVAANADNEPMRQLRWRRDGLLFGSDWTQVPDATVDADAWATYRQALRDLPANTTDPENAVWPTPPA